MIVGDEVDFGCPQPHVRRQEDGEDEDEKESIPVELVPELKGRYFGLLWPYAINHPGATRGLPGRDFVLNFLPGSLPGS